MHTTIGYALAYTSAATFEKLDAVEDQHIKTYLKKHYIGDMNHIIGAIACIGTTGLEARLVSPSLRRVNPFYIAPVEKAIVPTVPIAAIFHSESPVKLDTNEALELEARGTAGAPEEAVAAVFMAGGAILPVKGEIFTIDAHVHVTTVLHKWGFQEITFPDSLPVANYKVVGARLVAATGVAFRFVPVGEAYRPGGVIAQDVDDLDPDFQRFGGLGQWFSFTTIQPPGIEVLSSTAIAGVDHEIYIDLIKM